MENINRIEIQGAVGNSRLSTVGGTELLKLCVATNHIYKGRDGMAVIETTWHNVSYFKKPEDSLDLSQIERGSRVRVLGRLRHNRYTANDGREHEISEIVASELKLVEA